MFPAGFHKIGWALKGGSVEVEGCKFCWVKDEDLTREDSVIGGVKHKVNLAHYYQTWLINWGL